MSRLFPRLLFGLIVTAGAFASENEPAASSRQSLLARSPFVTTPTASPVPDSTGDLELSGFFGSGETLEVSITDKKTGRAVWVAPNDVGAPYLVTACTVEPPSAVVLIGGVSRRLGMRAASAQGGVIPIGAADEKALKASAEVEQNKRSKNWTPNPKPIPPDDRGALD